MARNEGEKVDGNTGTVKNAVITTNSDDPGFVGVTKGKDNLSRTNENKGGQTDLYET